MNRLFLAGILLFSPANVVQAQEESIVHATIIRGIDQLYNMEFEQATRSFDEVITMAPQDPRGYFFKSTVDYWIYLLSKEKTPYERFFALSDTVIDLCEKRLDANEKDWNAKFFQGAAYGFRGLMYQGNGSILKAVWDGKKGYNRLEECVLQKPDLVDAQMGFGLFTYLVGKIPKSYRWIVSIIGFSGDIALGLKYLRNAAENGVYARSEAAFYLSQFLNQEGNQDEALSYLRRLLVKHPDNTVFLLTYGSWQSQRFNIDTAMVAARKAVEINNRKKIKYGDEIAFNVLAQCYWVKNDFRSAKENIELYLQRVKNRDNIGNSVYYRLGICQEILGDRAGAVEVYKKIKKVENKDRAGDTFYYRKGIERIRSPLSVGDVSLLKTENEAAMKYYDAALSSYSNIAKSGTIDQRVLALYGMQQAYFNLEKYDSSLAVHSELAKLRPAGETWVIPYSYFLAGRTLDKQGKKSEAKTSFEMVERFDDYDFQQSLEDRTDRELSRLRSGT